MLANLKIRRVGSCFDEISGAVDEEQAWLSALEFSGNQYGRISRCPMCLYGLAVSFLHGVHRLTDDLRRTEHRVTIRSEEHTSELQSLMRISYAVFCLKKKNN